jgi:hypothetical protein
MAIPSKPAYSHGSTGTEPGTARDFENGDPLDADEFDYFVHTEYTKINEIIDALHVLDSDDDGEVDNADYAANSDKLDGYHYSDIQDWVQNNATISADQLDGSAGDPRQYLITDGSSVSWQNIRFPVRTSDPSSPKNGEAWIRSDL